MRAPRERGTGHNPSKRQEATPPVSVYAFADHKAEGMQIKVPSGLATPSSHVPVAHIGGIRTLLSGGTAEFFSSDQQGGAHPDDEQAPMTSFLRQQKPQACNDGVRAMPFPYIKCAGLSPQTGALISEQDGNSDSLQGHTHRLPLISVLDQVPAHRSEQGERQSSSSSSSRPWCGLKNRPPHTHTHSSLLLLPEVLFHRIYSFIPHCVAPHTIVCKAFRRELLTAPHARLCVRSCCPNVMLQAEAMRKFEGRVTVSVVALKDTLARNTLSSQVAEVLNGEWRCWRNLTSIDVRGNRIPKDCLARLAQTLQAFPALQTLDLSDNLMGPEGMRVLSLPLARCASCSLTALSLASNDLGVPGLALFSEHLGGGREIRLQKLDLSDNKITSHALGVLSAALKAAGASCLTDLDLSKNNFEGHAVEQLAQGLQGCSDLTALSLASNKLFGPPGAKFLGQILRRNTLLVTLDLSSAELFPEGMAVLAEPMRACVSLERVNLEDNKIGEAGARWLTLMFPSSTRLWRLNLSLNMLKKEGGTHVAALVTTLTSLSSLMLVHNNIPEKVRAEIKKCASNSLLLALLLTLRLFRLLSLKKHIRFHSHDH